MKSDDNESKVGTKYVQKCQQKMFKSGVERGGRAENHLVHVSDHNRSWLVQVGKQMALIAGHTAGQTSYETKETTGKRKKTISHIVGNPSNQKVN